MPSWRAVLLAAARISSASSALSRAGNNHSADADRGDRQRTLPIGPSFWTRSPHDRLPVPYRQGGARLLLDNPRLHCHNVLITLREVLEVVQKLIRDIDLVETPGTRLRGRCVTAHLAFHR